MFSALLLTMSLNTASPAVETCGSVQHAEIDAYSREYGPEITEWKPEICRQLTARFRDVEYSVMSYSRSNGLKANTKGKLSITPLKAGRVKLNWDAGSGGHQAVWLKVSARDEVWLFRKRLRRFEKVTKRDVRRKVIDVAKMVGVKEFFINSPVGKVVTRHVRKGDVVTNELVQDPPLISRKDEITVLANSGALSIRTKGIALNTVWKEGESLQVKVHGGTEPVRAIVTGVKQAYVEI